MPMSAPIAHNSQHALSFRTTQVFAKHSPHSFNYNYFCFRNVGDNGEPDNFLILAYTVRDKYVPTQQTKKTSLIDKIDWNHILLFVLWFKIIIIISGMFPLWLSPAAITHSAIKIVIFVAYFVVEGVEPSRDRKRGEKATETAVTRHRFHPPLYRCLLTTSHACRTEFRHFNCIFVPILSCALSLLRPQSLPCELLFALIKTSVERNNEHPKRFPFIVISPFHLMLIHVLYLHVHSTPTTSTCPMQICFDGNQTSRWFAKLTRNPKTKCALPHFSVFCNRCRTIIFETPTHRC